MAGNINYDPAEYGDNCAGFYDEIFPSVEAGLIRSLTELAGGGRVLELGIGTGRVAGRLGAAGVRIHGIDASQAMIDRCRVLPGADRFPIVRGDFARLPYAAAAFELVFSLVDTLSLLPTRELLGGCLAAVAGCLAPGGLFVHETYPCEDAHFAATHNVVITTGRMEVDYKVTSLNTSPESLEQIALSSGLRLKEVWQDWHGTKARPASPRQIMIFGSIADQGAE